MLSYIRRAQRRRMYERANSDSGCTNDQETPSSPVSSPENGPKSEGFHFYSSVKKQHSLPEMGAKNPSTNARTKNEKREEKVMNDAKTVEVSQQARTGSSTNGSL